MKLYFILPIVALCLALTACSKNDSPAAPLAAEAAQSPPTTAPQPATLATPTITLSRERIPAKGWVKVHGTGFTPKSDIRSHLRRPNGTEFPVLPMLTDAHGEITHDIDTLLLMVGTHDLWIVDSTTGVSSNVAHFEVTLDQGPAEKPE
jgi:hypothetical protein